MASEVIRNTVDRRSFRNAGLVMLAVALGLALALVVDDADRYPAVMAPGIVLAGVVAFVAQWRATPWLLSRWVVEIGPDAIRWRGGRRRRDRVIHRSQVASLMPARDGRFLQIRFVGVTGELVGRLPLVHFPAGRVFGALRRQSWPATTLEDVADAVRW